MIINNITRKLIVDEVNRRGWQVEGIGLNDYFLRITHPDGRREMLRGSMPMRTAAPGNILTQQKHLTLAFVQANGYEVPAYEVITTQHDAIDFLQAHGKIVVKPADGQQNRGVTTAVASQAEVLQAFDYAVQHSKTGKIIVQKHLDGVLYRLVVLNGKLVAAGLRTAAAVVGDGRHTVKELIELANKDPLRSEDFSQLEPIDIRAAEHFMGSERFMSMIAPDERITVSPIDSTSAGGESRNVTDEVHADWRQFTEIISKEAGLFLSGFDVICDDISQPIQGTLVPLLEINSGPGMQSHEYPTAGGQPIHLAPLLLNALFPEPA